MGKKIRLKIGNSEIELEGESTFIEKHLTPFINTQGYGAHYPIVESKAGKVALPSKVTVAPDKLKKMSPAEYVRAKKPNGRTEYLIVFAKYLGDYKSLSEFSKKDIAKVVRDAKVKPIESPYYILAAKQGLLNRLGHSKYQLTLSGEDAVSAMPASKK